MEGGLFYEKAGWVAKKKLERCLNKEASEDDEK